MKQLLGLMMVLVALAAVTAFMPGCEMAQAAAVSPAKISPQRNTTIYFGDHTYRTGKSCDTLVWSSDRNFNDTANYDCAVFTTNGNVTGPIAAVILNDSSIIFTSATAGDSLKYFFYQVVLKKE